MAFLPFAQAREVDEWLMRALELVGDVVASSEVTLGRAARGETRSHEPFTVVLFRLDSHQAIREGKRDKGSAPVQSVVAC